jgi:hypothetical protein
MRDRAVVIATHLPDAFPIAGARTIPIGKL